MTHSNSWWIVTDLDGTLLDHSYNWEPARTTLRWLQEQQIPVIPCTSRRVFASTKMLIATPLS